MGLPFISYASTYSKLIYIGVRVTLWSFVSRSITKLPAGSVGSPWSITKIMITLNNINEYQWYIARCLVSWWIPYPHRMSKPFEICFDIGMVLFYEWNLQDTSIYGGFPYDFPTIFSLKPPFLGIPTAQVSLLAACVSHPSPGLLERRRFSRGLPGGRVESCGIGPRWGT